MQSVITGVRGKVRITREESKDQGNLKKEREKGIGRRSGDDLMRLFLYTGGEKRRERRRWRWWEGGGMVLFGGGRGCMILIVCI